jgi:amidohydrolase
MILLLMPYRKLMSDKTFNRLVKIRRRIHQYPEPAYKEVKTAALVAKELTRLGIPFKERVARTGVVGRLGDGAPGAVPTVALRADMDALPIEEKSGLPFSSRVKGFMHACGHDGHTAMLLGAAELLRKAPPEGNVLFVFQPAEEGGAGALAMRDEGVLEGVDMIFGGHIDAHYRLGEIAIRADVETSFTDALQIRIVGKGGHAARPHESVDAVLVASLFVIALQTIISRNIDPLHPAVITVGTVRAGSVYNAIADEAVMKGTLRSTDATTRKRVLARINKTAASLAALHEAQIEVDVREGYPPVINHPEGYALAREVAEGLVGTKNLINLRRPSLGGEDFAYYLERVPGCFVRFGAARGGFEAPVQHSSTFDFEEEVLRLGAIYYAEVARRSIQKLKGKKPGAPGV